MEGQGKGGAFRLVFKQSLPSPCTTFLICLSFCPSFGNVEGSCCGQDHVPGRGRRNRSRAAETWRCSAQQRRALLGRRMPPPEEMMLRKTRGEFPGAVLSSSQGPFLQMALRGKKKKRGKKRKKLSSSSLPLNTFCLYFMLVPRYLTTVPCVLSPQQDQPSCRG